jgi:hypothetical protein
MAVVGLAISLGGLGLLFRTLRYLSLWLVRYGLLIFMGLTPAFVLRSDCVGNDSMVAFFGIFYFFCLQRLNRDPGRLRHFWWSVAALLFELFTKISGLILVVSLPWLFWRSAQRPFSARKTVTYAGVVAALIFVWLGLVLYRAWVPETRSFLFVKWAPYAAQVIDESFFKYTLNFSLPDLIRAGQTSIYGSRIPQHVAVVDSVRASYPTWVFGNMLIGDWDYDINPRLLDGARAVIIFGTIFPFGFILFAATTLLGRPIKAAFSPLNKTALALVVGMTGLSLYYTLTRPTVCCADYRLQAVTFAWAGWCFCRGWTVFPRGWALRTLAIVFLGGYATSCLLLYYIIEHTPNIPGTFW